MSTTCVTQTCVTQTCVEVVVPPDITDTCIFYPGLFEVCGDCSCTKPVAIQISSGDYNCPEIGDEYEFKITDGCNCPDKCGDVYVDFKTGLTHPYCTSVGEDGCTIVKFGPIKTTEKVTFEFKCKSLPVCA